MSTSRSAPPLRSAPARESIVRICETRAWETLRTRARSHCVGGIGETASSRAAQEVASSHRRLCALPPAPSSRYKSSRSEGPEDLYSELPPERPSELPHAGSTVTGGRTNGIRMPCRPSAGPNNCVRGRRRASWSVSGPFGHTPPELGQCGYLGRRWTHRNATTCAFNPRETAMDRHQAPAQDARPRACPRRRQHPCNAWPSAPSTSQDAPASAVRG